MHITVCDSIDYCMFSKNQTYVILPFNTQQYDYSLTKPDRFVPIIIYKLKILAKIIVNTCL